MNKFERFTTFFSFLALIISVIVFYFQFLHSNHTVFASVIDSNCTCDSTIDISSQIVYSNKGNTYSTVLQNRFILYFNGKDELDKHNRRIFLKNDFENIEKYEPVVLMPGEQQIKKIILHDSFLKNSDGTYNYYIGDKIYVAIEIYFLNSENQKTNELIDIGWIILDKNLKVSQFGFDYKTVELKGNGYYSHVGL